MALCQVSGAGAEITYLSTFKKIPFLTLGDTTAPFPPVWLFLPRNFEPLLSVSTENDLFQIQNPFCELKKNRK